MYIAVAGTGICPNTLIVHRKYYSSNTNFHNQYINLLDYVILPTDNAVLKPALPLPPMKYAPFF
jgi:hypothetical protein